MNLGQGRLRPARRRWCTFTAVLAHATHIIPELRAQDLDLDAEADVRVLVLLWRLGAKEKPGEVRVAHVEGGARIKCF